VAQQPSPSMVEELTAAWQRVLHTPSVGPSDNFFEMGGGPTAAAELSCEIERRLGRTMPPMTLYHTPTIASLTEALRHPSFPHIPALTRLRPGGGGTPLYIAHGVGGSVLEFFELVKLIDSGRAIYGMQAKGSDGTSDPLDRIEDMAAFHLQAIRQLQPHGPYFLAGHSLGGLVALEIARAVLESGEEPGLVVMIDSYPHLKRLAPNQQARLIASLVARRVFGAKEPTENPSNEQGSRSPQNLEVPAAIGRAMRRVRESGYVALERYRPRFYNGKIHFIRAQTPSIFPKDAAAVWSQFARKFEIETAPGDHLGMLTTHVDALASLLSRYGREFDGVAT